MSILYIITGPAGVGKSTISNLLAERMKRSALIEGDDIYHMVCGGYVKPWLEGNHLDVFWENCINLITNFLDREYDVVFNYICKPRDIEFIANKVKAEKIKICVLITDEDTIKNRDKMRPVDYQMGERSIVLLNEFKDMRYCKEYYFDTTLLTPDDTVEEIIRNQHFDLKV
ncbi:hypothetical protein ACQPU1_07405 [Clostridium paraputrificum]|uniref:hypothetical protein n=1 Tax=Clostridium paraputrificum TaxID=29363 RepID=UPI003D329DB9